jgi:hypothetical protein
VDLSFLKALTDSYLQGIPLSDDYPERQLAVVIGVPSADAGRNLIAALQRKGFTKTELEQKRSLWRKRWQVIALSAPVAYRGPELNKWLESLYGFAQSQGAMLEYWVPTDRAA